MSLPPFSASLPDGSPSQLPFRVAVVGAGWSGLACAEALSASAQAGGAIRGGRMAITLIEAAPQAGGRARGLSWLPEGWADTEALPIDNGQHLLIGAYTATRDLLRRTGVADEAWQQYPLHWVVPGAAHASGTDIHPDLRPGLNPGLANQHRHQPLRQEAHARLLVVPSDGGVKRLLKSALPQTLPAGYAGWPLAWQLSLAKTLARGWQTDWSAQGTAEAWWKQQSVPPELLRYFWKPMVEGALNTPFAEASARVALQVIKDSLLGPAHASDTLHPVQSLTAQAVGPITQALQQRGVQLVFGCRVVGITARHHKAADSVTAVTEAGPATGADPAHSAHPAKPNDALGWFLQFHPTSQTKAAESGLTEALFDAVVLALPARGCRTIAFDLPDSLGRTRSGEYGAARDELSAFAQERHRWDTVHGLGVTTLYAALRPDQAARAGLSPEVLRPVSVTASRPHPESGSTVDSTDSVAQGDTGSGVAMVLARPEGPQGQVIAAVASATARENEAETHQLLQAAVSEVLAPRLGDDTFAKIPLRTTHDYQATWACTADHVDSGAAWGPSALGPAGLYRAGDDLTPGYPACIESAVRGGVQTAQAVIAQAMRK